MSDYLKVCKKNPQHTWLADIEYCPYCNHTQEERIEHINLETESKKLKDMMNFHMNYASILPKKKREVFSDRLSKNKYLYFIACGDAIKIGISSHPDSRLETLATGAPGKLSLIAMFPNMGHREAEFHKRFACLNIHGEWFRYTNEIHELIKELSK